MNNNKIVAELIAALEALLPHLDKRCTIPDVMGAELAYRNREWNAVVDQARAALAKAKGEK